MWTWLARLIGIAEQAGGVSSRVALTLDPTAGDRRLKTLRGELRTGQWLEVKRHLDSLSDPDERTRLIEVLAEGPGELPLAGWVAAEPESSLPLLLRARNRIYWAWEARGSGTADTVSASGANAFLDRLELAEDDLEAAAALDPKDPTPHAFGLITARGLGIPLAEARARFARAQGARPDHLLAHQALLVRLCEKWGGSHEAMFAHAREATAQAGPGSRLHALIPMAHAERWLFGYAFDEDESFARYFERPEVIEEIEAAHEACFARGRKQARLVDLELRNHFAFALWLGKRGGKARRELQEIGTHFTQLPWGFLDAPDRAFARARGELGLG